MESSCPKRKGRGFHGKFLLALVPTDPTGPLNEEVKAMQVKIVEEWNRHGEDTTIFEYPSKIVEGNVVADKDDTITLDHTITNGDIIDIIMVSYGIEHTKIKELSELAEDKDIVGSFFSSYDEGKTSLMNYVDTLTKEYN